MRTSRTAGLAESLAASLLAERPHLASPPVDVDRLARELGVESITSVPMVEDGRLEQRGGRTWMLVREDVWQTRRRFTVAHELGHLLLADSEREFVAHRSLPGRHREERFCDAFAAALLLPRVWVLQRFGGAQPESLATLRGLAEASGVSLAACTLRLREVSGWTSSLLRWRQHDGAWRLASTSGLPRGLRVTSAPRTSSFFDDIAASRADRVENLPLSIAGSPTVIGAQVAVRGRSALALAHLGGHEALNGVDPLLDRLQAARSAP